MSQSLTRALEILRLLGEAPASLDELADELGVHKTTVLRLLRPLVDARFAYHDEAHRYHLGSRVFDLAARASEQRGIREIAAPHLVAFNRQYGRTTHLAAREGDAVVYIDKLESRDLIRMYSRVGMEVNLNSSAVGKLMLSTLPDDELRRFVAGMDFTRRTPNTIVTPRTTWPRSSASARRTGRRTARRTSPRSTASALRSAMRAARSSLPCPCRCPTWSCPSTSCWTCWSRCAPRARRSPATAGTARAEPPGHPGNTETPTRAKESPP